MELDSMTFYADHNSTESNTKFRPWTFWVYKKDHEKTRNECLHEVATCRSIDEFWTLYKLVKLPSHLDTGCDYAFFRNAIQPIWEGEPNRNGGRWVIALDNFVEAGEINKLWMDTLMILINESLVWQSSICGVVFSSRWKQKKISIWIADSADQAPIGNELRKKLHLSESVPFTFMRHPIA